MITRTDIINKLDEYPESNQMEKYSLIAEWLDTQTLTGEEKTKILDDLISYGNY